MQKTEKTNEGISLGWAAIVFLIFLAMIIWIIYETIQIIQSIASLFLSLLH